MANQVTEQELRQQAVRALSDRLRSVDALRFSASLWFTRSAGKTIFRITV
jgi:hypothetical protein